MKLHRHSSDSLCALILRHSEKLAAARDQQFTASETLRWTKSAALRIAAQRGLDRASALVRAHRNAIAALAARGVVEA